MSNGCVRQALGDGARIETCPDGYVITVADGELDVSGFERYLAASRTAASDGSWQIAAEQARAALALWRGKPLVDVPSDLLAVREVPWLAELRVQALEARIEADLRLGRHGEVIAELQQPGQRRKPEPVGVIPPRAAAELAAQRLVLMAQHEQVDVLGQVRPDQHRQQAEQAPHQAVDERQRHAARCSQPGHCPRSRITAHGTRPSFRAGHP
jgi:transcriptional activator